MRGTRRFSGLIVATAVVAVLAAFAAVGCRPDSAGKAPPRPPQTSQPKPPALPASQAGPLAVGPYLFAHGPTTMAVCWATAKPETGRVEFGATTQYDRRVEAGQPLARQKVLLTGLTPGAAYHYRVATPGGATDDFTFRALPGPGEPLTFVVDGDQRASDRYKRHLAAYRRIRPAFVISLGDIANDNGDDFDYVLLLDREFWATTPWQVVFGNHDRDGDREGRGAIRDVFAFPEPALPVDAKPAMVFYSFRAGACHFAAVDEIKHVDESQQGEPRLQIDWLLADLADARADRGVRFIITLRHDSHRSLWPLSKASRPPIDVFFYGGIHNYFRGVLDNGVTVVQTSGGGVDYLRDLPQGDWVKAGRTCLNYVRADCRGDRLTLEAFDLGLPDEPVESVDGDPLDRVELRPLNKAPLTQPDEEEE